jgi:pyruvate dehydrogenase phosphatase
LLKFSLDLRENSAIYIQRGTILASETEKPRCEILAITEGHYGHHNAQFVQQRVMDLVMARIVQLYNLHPPEDNPNSPGWYVGFMAHYHRPSTSNIHISLRETFQALDQEILDDLVYSPSGPDLQNYTMKSMTSSSVAMAVYEYETQILHIASLGSSIALLGRQRASNDMYDVHVLSADHSPKNPAEQGRIRSAHPGENIIHDGLLFGRHYTRAFGDAALKISAALRERFRVPESFSGMSDSEGQTPPYISSEPDITDVRLLSGDFVVLASGWISNCLSHEEIVGLVGLWLNKHPPHKRPFAIEKFVPITVPIDEVIERESLPVRLKDDTTVMYPQWKAPKRFINVDLNVATHLGRNAMGGANSEVREELLNNLRHPDLPRYAFDLCTHLR